MSDAIAIIGAGVAGLCTAAACVDRGLRVSLHDREQAPGPHACSWWAGGMLAPFCEGESAEEPVQRLGQQAAAWWQDHGADVTRAGSLVVALGRDGRELDRFARRSQGHMSITPASLATLEPDLEGQVRKALFFEDEAHLDPRQALAALVAYLEAHGVTIRTDGAPDGARLIDCRGLSARPALPDLRGVKGEMLVIRTHEIGLNRPVRLLHPRIPLYIVPRGSGVFMLGATVVEATERTRITARAMLEMLSAAYALHPAFAEAEVIEIGVDARPAFPDNLPRIRQVGRTLHANGLFRHGFLLGPALGTQVADLVAGNTTKPEFLDEDNAERGAA